MKIYGNMDLDLDWVEVGSDGLLGKASFNGEEVLLSDKELKELAGEMLLHLNLLDLSELDFHTRIKFAKNYMRGLNSQKII